MVRRNLECHENHDQQCPRQVFFSVHVYQSRNGGWDICQCNKLPDVTGGDKYKKIGGECPYDGSQRTDQRRCPECPHKDVEPQ